jgi:hypothetical protein
MDISSVPWLNWGANPTPPEQTPKLGWMTEALEIDPFDSDRMMYGTGATIYGTENLTAWDTGGKPVIKPMVKGLEETAVLDLIAPPSGATLISGLGDIGGFRHTDLDAVPPTMFQSPNFTSTTSLDYAESNPNQVVRAGNVDSGAHIAFSHDNGANWYAGSDPSGVTGGGTVAIAADGGRFVWSPEGAGVHTGTGSSWTASTGIPAGAIVESDRVDAKKFYGFKDGAFYVSTDGGVSFTKRASTGLPEGTTVRFKAVPGRGGDIWLAGGEKDKTYGLWHSTDSGATFTKVSGVQEADTIGFGKAAPGAAHQTLYTSAKIGGVRGIFRSTDAGATWVRINDDQNQWGWTGSTITGDPRTYGRVYVSTNGRGIVYADTASIPSPTGPTDPPEPTDPPDPTDPPEPTDPPDPGTDGVCTAAYRVTNQWSGGFQAEVKLTNTGDTAWSDWKLGWTFADGQRVTALWSGSHTQSGGAVTVTNTSWNGRVAPGGSVTVGFTATSTGANTAPDDFTRNGAACD